MGRLGCGDGQGGSAVIRGLRAGVLGLAIAWAAPATGQTTTGGTVAAQVRQHPGQALAVVDKRSAQLWVFDAQGALVGHTAALLGRARGDTLPPGNRDKAPDDLAPDERLTPAGRFATVPGLNLAHDRVVWFDHGAGLAIHRLRQAPAAERRPQRLRSPSAQDNRITLGCVVVDPAFFDSVVWPVLGHGPARLVILHEDGRWPPAGAAGGPFESL